MSFFREMFQQRDNSETEAAETFPTRIPIVSDLSVQRHRFDRKISSTKR